jgi:hypothetical protein
LTAIAGSHVSRISIQLASRTVSRPRRSIPN